MPEGDDEMLRCYPDLMRYALHLAQDRDAAEDLVQDTYLRAYRFDARFRRGSSRLPWLFTICRNTYRTRVRRERRVTPRSHRDIESLIDRLSERVQATTTANIDLPQAIDEALDTLPPPMRQIVVLVDLNDQSYECVAARLGIPVGTVRSRLSRSRRRLRSVLRQHALDEGIGSAECQDAASTRERDRAECDTLRTAIRTARARPIT